MTITGRTERDGYVSYSTETALQRAVTRFMDDPHGGRMILDARLSRAELDDDIDLVQEIDRQVVCRTIQQAWAAVQPLLEFGGHLELDAPAHPVAELDGDDEIAA